MEVETIGADAVKLGEPAFGEGPEGFDAVDVLPRSARELRLIMVDPIVPVAVEHEAVVGHPTVGVDRTAPTHEFPDKRRDFPGTGIADDLGGDPAVAFQDAEDRHLGCTSAAPPLALAAEVALVELDRSPEGLIRGFLVGSDPFPEQAVVAIDRVAIDAGEVDGLRGCQIFAKTPHQFS